MLCLIKKSPVCTDETVYYEVKLYKEYTVEELIKEILALKEFGVIDIKHTGSESSLLSFKYKSGTCDLGFGHSELLINKVKFANAHGGWGRMHYTIYI